MVNTSVRVDLGTQFEKYRIRINPLDMHHVIHATPLASDSPIRRADGSVQPSGVEELYKRVEELVAMPSDQRRATFQSRRQKMLSEKIDCAKFLTYFIENYPQSVEAVRRADKSFWEKFK